MISIIIPTLQEEKDIEKTIRQFDGLAIPHEIIVSDGQSTDRTVEIARAAGARVVVSERLIRTPSHQRNDGAKIATGDYFVFIDSTVMLGDVEGFLKKALSHFENDSKVVGLAVAQWIYPEVSTFADHAILSITNSILKLQQVGSGKFVMTSRKAFEKIHGFREDLVTREDGDFFMRLKTIGTVKFDEHLPIYYSGRREHTWGWGKLLWVWTVNVVWVLLFKKALAKEWTPVR